MPHVTLPRVVTRLHGVIRGDYIWANREAWGTVVVRQFLTNAKKKKTGSGGFVVCS